MTGASLPVRVAGLTYALSAFIVTHFVFVLFIAFLLNLASYPAVSGIVTWSAWPAAAWDAALIALFGLQHTGMARTALKRVIVSYLPEPLERATYVHLANLSLLLLNLAWQPIGATLWSLEAPAAVFAIHALFAAGWAVAGLGSLLIDHLWLLGLRQAWAWARGGAAVEKPFQEHWLYETARHPIQTGLILSLWATPHMTVGHALLAAGLTLYILIGTWFEEKDLVARFGEPYEQYRRRVPAFLPRLFGRRRP